MNYGDKLILMEGIITKVTDGSVEMDLKGRLGTLVVPKRMLITDYELQPGQEVAFNMSFPEVKDEKPNEDYLKNIMRRENKEVQNG